MANRELILVGAFVVLMMVCTPAMGASRIRRQTTIDANVGANASLPFLNAFQAFINASAGANVQWQQAVQSLFQNGTNVTLATIQQLQQLFQQLRGNLTAQQIQRLQDAFNLLGNFTQAGAQAFQQLVSQAQTGINNIMKGFQNLANILSTLQSGLQNILNQNPGTNILNSASNLLNLLNSGNLTSIFGANANFTSSGPKTLQQILDFLKTVNASFNARIQADINILNGFVTLIATGFTNLFSLFGNLFGSLFG